MAYDLIGINPSSSFGKAFRCNTFLWHDILIILYCCEAIDRPTARSMMFSDGFVLEADRCIEVAQELKALAMNRSIIDMCLDSYMDFRPYRDTPEISGIRHGMVEKLGTFAMFLERCGGFRVL